MNETVQALLILMVAYTFFLIVSVTFIHFLKRSIMIMRHDKKIRNEVKKRKKMIADMKERGELHEWITIQQKDLKGEVHNLNVCKKTGWCPQFQQFFQMPYVEAEMARQEYKKQYEEYRDAHVEILATKFRHSREEMEEIVESVFDIKKQFALLWIKERNAEVQIEQDSQP